MHTKLYGDGGADTIKGGSGFDEIFGGSGADKLYGNGGADYLSGGEGNDRLDGGRYSLDTLVGGANADTFVIHRTKLYELDAANHPMWFGDWEEEHEDIDDFLGGIDGYAYVNHNV